MADGRGRPSAARRRRPPAAGWPRTTGWPPPGCGCWPWPRVASPADEVDAGRRRHGRRRPIGYVDGLTLEALVGIVDPPATRPATPSPSATGAGIEVKMITGDHAATAAAIAASLGIDGEVVSGDELDAMDDDELAGAHRRHRRVRPGLARAQGPGRAGPAGQRPRGGHDRRRRQRRRRAAHRRHRRGHGHHRHRGHQGGGRHGAGRRQLRHRSSARSSGAAPSTPTSSSSSASSCRPTWGPSPPSSGPACSALPVPFSPIQVLWVNLIADGPPAMTLGRRPARRPGHGQGAARARTPPS